MIPIKKLKKQTLAEFEKQSVEMEIAVQRKRINGELKGHYLKIPWCLDRGGYMAVRWNIKHNRFDRITFPAFGKLHNIKL